MFILSYLKTLAMIKKCDLFFTDSGGIKKTVTQEFRRGGIPVVPFVPSKGNDKNIRVNSVAPIFESG